MAKLVRRPLLFLLFLASVLSAVGCSSTDDDPSTAIEDSIPTTTQDPADPFERIAGGVVLMDTDGFLQLCFRLVDQDGKVLCADARASYSPDDYEVFDGSRIGMEELGDITISSEPAWLYAADFDDGVHLELRKVGQGEIIQ